jgi:uncharacterized membrane protein YfcA
VKMGTTSCGGIYTNAQISRKGEMMEEYDKNKLFRWSSATIILTFVCIGIINHSRGNYDNNAMDISRTLQEEVPYTFELTHKKAYPLSWDDKLGFFLAIIGLMVAAGGGIGGGGILVPIYILVMNFSPKHAIPLSNITIFGGALANNLLNAKKRHPFADRPLIDWDLILVMEPLTIGGALMGAFLNKLLPETLLVTMLIILLTFTAYNTIKKALILYAKESAQKKNNQSALTEMMSDEEDEFNDEADDTLLENSEEVEMIPNKSDSIDDEEEGTEDIPAEFSRQKELEKILEHESITPMEKIIALALMFLVILFMNIMKGGGAFPSPVGIKCGSGLFWLANGFMLLWIFLISNVARNYLVNRYKHKKKIGYKYVDGDIQWDERATIFYPSVCCLAGFAAGMFGIGGGIIKGPLMLAMGVHPKVSSASSACMILFTSFTATTSFFVFGLIDFDYAVICIIIGFFATLIGQIGLSYVMKKNDRNSYIAFSIGGVVLLSALLMTIQSLVSAAEKKDRSHGSGGVCGDQF